MTQPASAPVIADDTIVEDVDEVDAVAPSAVAVSYFGTEFDVHGLVRRYNDGAIIVPSFDPSLDLPDPNAQGFQRGRVWRRAQMDRFIESLLLGFPVPGIFLVEQPGKKYLVLDGQQRLTTLAGFYAGKFKIENVDDELKGLTYNTLPDDVRRTLDDTFIQAIIIRVPQSVADYESVYQIFERLNSGGTNLQPHEIRVALYGGKLVETVRSLNNNEHWRLLYGKRSDRLKDQELILRVVALYLESSNYYSPLKTFLNDFLGKHRQGDYIDLAAVENLFEQSARILAEAIGRRAFRLRTQVNAAILDSVFVGVMERIAAGSSSTVPARAWAMAYDTLLKQESFLDAVTQATANEDSVETRLAAARAAFGKL
ncbi:hypothetical protein BKA08_000293 [Nocardioides marinisabuli]|uniref:GmrSD restriction endonucleases N-terminal domain-containing protein n=1 Tax=Nocardioides marinisabuli TaxID=419476 RepID=A0A7Y9EY19_9ACTN|nr:DUF262 domain-containing protein [Nocardioides marinisabuli]NYD56055.1 hypothetical protein [Nocardioides marinisabuli]